MLPALLSLLISVSPVLAEDTDSIMVMSWNLENYFDWKNDSTSVSDGEFSSRGVKRWTRRRVLSKSNAIAKTILFTADERGRLPDFICFQEVENARALKTLLNETALYKTDFRFIHRDSPDSRGIDVAILYRATKWIPDGISAVQPKDSAGNILMTRDILSAGFSKKGETGPKLHIVACHLPSKYGGAAVSKPRREQAVMTLCQIADSLEATAPAIICGDFNDVPSSETFAPINGRLRNLALPFEARGEGTLRYKGVWEIIDMFLISRSFQNYNMEIPEIPFLMVRDRKYGGMKPLRTYSGPRYLGGVSDHRPILLEAELP